MDWVPCHTYGVVTTVPSNSQSDVPLINPSTWTTLTEVVGAIEDRANSYRCVRIIGQFDLWFDTTQDQGGSFQWRIWPGLQSVALGTGITPGLISDPVVANERFWYERRVWSAEATTTINAFKDPNYHPFWNYVDVKPGAYIGTTEVPIFSMQNTSSEDANIRLYLRMLVR